MRRTGPHQTVRIDDHLLADGALNVQVIHVGVRARFLIHQRDQQLHLSLCNFNEVEACSG